MLHQISSTVVCRRIELHGYFSTSGDEISAWSLKKIQSEEAKPTVGLLRTEMPVQIWADAGF